MTPRARSILWPATRHFLLLTGALVMLTPFIWMLSTASKPQTEIFSSDLHLIPYHFALWDNLQTAFAKANLWRYLLNGLVVTISIFGLQVLVALPAAYALAKLRFLGRDVLFALVVFCILIPPQATAIPVFLLLHTVGVLDSYAALGKFDIVFCRNVLIYFSADVKKDILKRIHATLRPGGYLFLGASEALNGLPELYQMVQCSPGIIYKAK